jgi:CheY-like chemotaxis protein
MKRTILLAEDDDGHATLIRRNLERARLNAELVRVRNGQELLDRLAELLAGGSTEAEILVLLDVSMPKLDGIEVLRRLKSNPSMSSIPVYMLTTTDNPAEVNRCFDLGCNAYVMKPVAYDAFTAAIQRLCAFLEVSQLPNQPTLFKNVSA